MRILLAQSAIAATAAIMSLAPFALCAIPCSALAAGHNQTFVTSRSGVISTSLGNNKVAASSLVIFSKVSDPSVCTRRSRFVMAA